MGEIGGHADVDAEHHECAPGRFIDVAKVPHGLDHGGIVQDAMGALEEDDDPFSETFEDSEGLNRICGGVLLVGVDVLFLEGLTRGVQPDEPMGQIPLEEGKRTIRESRRGVGFFGLRRPFDGAVNERLDGTGRIGGIDGEERHRDASGLLKLFN